MNFVEPLELELELGFNIAFSHKPRGSHLPNYPNRPISNPPPRAPTGTAASVGVGTRRTPSKGPGADTIDRAKRKGCGEPGTVWRSGAGRGEVGEVLGFAPIIGGSGREDVCSSHQHYSPPPQPSTTSSAGECHSPKKPSIREASRLCWCSVLFSKGQLAHAPLLFAPLNERYFFSPVGPPVRRWCAKPVDRLLSTLSFSERGLTNLGDQGIHNKHPVQPVSLK